MDVIIMVIHNGMAFVQNVIKICKYKDEWMLLLSIYLNFDYVVIIFYTLDQGFTSKSFYYNIIDKWKY